MRGNIKHVQGFYAIGPILRFHAIKSYDYWKLLNMYQVGIFQLLRYCFLKTMHNY